MSSLSVVLKEVPAVIPDEVWNEAGSLSCLFSIDLPIPKFTVRDLLQLEPGAIVESRKPNGSDVPVIVNSQLIGWAEFEVVGQKIAVRLTELA
jgi:flagellar motor switch protein FliN/FliY